MVKVLEPPLLSVNDPSTLNNGKIKRVIKKKRSSFDSFRGERVTVISSFLIKAISHNSNKKTSKLINKGIVDKGAIIPVLIGMIQFAMRPANIINPILKPKVRIR